MNNYEQRELLNLAENTSDQERTKENNASRLYEKVKNSKFTESELLLIKQKVTEVEKKY